MDKLDYKKEYRQLYAAKSDQPQLVEVPTLTYLMINGKGDPNTSQEYTDAIQTLYPAAYTIKFMCKKELDKDFSVMPLEGLWWTEDMSQFSTENKSNWQWTAMIMLPGFVTPELYERAMQQLADKKKPASLDKLRLQSYTEGRAAQVLYIGPYSDEGPAIQQLHDFIKQSGGSLDENNKHHHEIYLSDPRRADPSKLKTIIRQPFQK